VSSTQAWQSSLDGARPEMVELARQLRRPNPDRRPVSLQDRGHPGRARLCRVNWEAVRAGRRWNPCSANRKPPVRVSFQGAKRATPTRKTHPWPSKGHCRRLYPHPWPSPAGTDTFPHHRPLKLMAAMRRAFLAAPVCPAALAALRKDLSPNDQNRATKTTKRQHQPAAINCRLKQAKSQIKITVMSDYRAVWTTRSLLKSRISLVIPDWVSLKK
jgi:hypothetical protein